MQKIFKNILLLLLIVFLSSPAMAEDDMTSSESQQQEKSKAPAIHDYIAYLQSEWAHINFRINNKKAKIAAIEDLEKYASGVSGAFKNSPEPKIWEAIILATDAGINKSISGLSKLKKAKKLLEASISEDPKALGSAAYTTLGSLYYQVPGWPISFGDNKKAGKLLKEALINNPNGIDANYFYGDFLLNRKHYEEAIQVLQKALSAPDRPNRPVADMGRRKEIKKAITKAEKKLGIKHVVKRGINN